MVSILPVLSTEGQLGLTTGVSAMRHHRVHDIIRPYHPDLPVRPSVAPGDRLIRAVELMMAGGLRQIAVMQSDRPVGLVELAEALNRLGIDPPGMRNIRRKNP